MGQIQFTVSDETDAYLKWLAKEILFESTASKAARHIFLKGLEETRRSGRHQEPLFSETASIAEDE